MAIQKNRTMVIATQESKTQIDRHIRALCFEERILVQDPLELEEKRSKMLFQLILSWICEKGVT